MTTVLEPRCIFMSARLPVAERVSDHLPQEALGNGCCDSVWFAHGKCAATPELSQAGPRTQANRDFPADPKALPGVGCSDLVRQSKFHSLKKSLANSNDLAVTAGRATAHRIKPRDGTDGRIKNIRAIPRNPGQKSSATAVSRSQHGPNALRRTTPRRRFTRRGIRTAVRCRRWLERMVSRSYLSSCASHDLMILSNSSRLVPVDTNPCWFLVVHVNNPGTYWCQRRHCYCCIFPRSWPRVGDCKHKSRVARNIPAQEGHSFLLPVGNPSGLSTQVPARVSTQK